MEIILLKLLGKLVIFSTTVVATMFGLIGSLFRREGHLSATTYRGKPSEDAPFCLVCFDGVTRGERIRVLPRCKHCYHVGCIDAWLESHSTCPICRVQVIPAVLQQEQRRLISKRRNVVISLLLVVEDLSTKLGYPLDFGISIGLCE